MANLQSLKTELTTDPLGRGYSGMSDAQAATDIESKYRPVDKLTMTGAELHGSIDLTEYRALTASVRAEVNTILALSGPISTVSGSQSRTWLLAAFGAGTATRTALQAAVQQQIARSVELFGATLTTAFGYPTSTAAVTAARALP